ncbi:UvrD-helicase domain-containing protein [Endozoicomonas atrinae]|uniref:UvrD-helicase domain-containing protein n=1 Tax=Endozoicomonas atrinae TaxID=1333660 RepID=UPI0008247D2A|nr:UvrD-helicase domain-containing protein [Endozoicomonas atrinae]
MAKELKLAGAGSGKTYSIQTVVAEKLIAGELTPEQLMVVTFTKKAAAELQERIAGQLLKNTRFDLVARLGEARIGTVNSVCGELVQKFAFELGLSPELQVLDEKLSEALIAEALDGCLIHDETARLNRLAEKFQVESWQRDVLKVIEAARLNGIAAGQLPDFASKSIDELLSLFPEDDPSITEEKLREAADAFIAEAEGVQGRSSTLNGTISWVKNAISGRVLVWDKWVSLPGKKAAKKDGDIPSLAALHAIAGGFIHNPELRQDLRDFISDIFAAAEKALGEYQRYKEERGLIDFADQELQLLRALETPFVERTLREQLGYLVVDEFQDTSPVQLALFSRLSEFANDTLFVGDIKQAIYGFRGADPELCLGVLNHFQNGAGTVSSLTDSYRSRPGLVHLSNALFEKPFGQILSADQVRLNPAKDYTLELPETGWWQVEGKNQGDKAIALAGMLVEFASKGQCIHDKHLNQPRAMTFRDIAVLCPRNDDVAKVAEALASLGVPVASVRSGLLETSEVTLALACYRRLIDQSDDLASAEILSLMTGENAEGWLEQRLSSLDDQEACWSDNAHLALKRLAYARSQAVGLTPAEVLALAIEAAGVIDRVISWEEGNRLTEHRLANLQSLQVLAEEYTNDCRAAGRAGTTSGFLIWVRELEQNGADLQAENPGNAVTVTTYHKSKGLEWPVVVSTGLDNKIKYQLWGLQVKRNQEFNWENPLAGRELRYWPHPCYHYSRKNDPFTDLLKATPEWGEMEKRVNREQLQLLYVGLTRARDHLVFVQEGKNAVGERLQLLNSNLLPLAAETVTLPDGHLLKVQSIELNEASQPEIKARQRNWLPNNRVDVPVDGSGLFFAPPSSAAPVDGCTATIVHNFNTRISVAGKHEDSVVGNCVHHALAYLLQNGDVEEKVLQGLLDQHLPGAIKADEVIRRAQQLMEWIQHQFPEAKIYTEVPITRMLGNGALENGRIDLLLGTADGWVIIDHKSYQGGQSMWQAKAEEYSGQLAVYASALQVVTDRKVMRSFIHFAVAGGIVEASQ